MRVKQVTIEFNNQADASLVNRQYIDGVLGVTDLHYILRDTQHVVNYTNACGERVGHSFNVHDIKEVITIL